MSLLALALLTTVGQGPTMKLGEIQGIRDPKNFNLFIPNSSIAHNVPYTESNHTNFELLLSDMHKGTGEEPLALHGPFAKFQGAGELSPPNVVGAYGVVPGGGGVICIVDAYDDPNALAEFNAFSMEYGLPTQSGSNQNASTNTVFQVVYATGTKPASAITKGWNVEESLDIEWSHVMAPNAKIVLVEAANTGSGLYTAVQVASAIAGVREVSMSWGGSEGSGESSDDSYFSTRGIVYFAAAGDHGAQVIYPSASPNCVSCGGTQLTVGGGNTWQSESAWSSGGGGPSAYEPRPSYQNGISLVGAHRGTPDIAATASNEEGYAVWIYYSTSASSQTWGAVGGTSVATPILSGIHNSSTTIHRSSEWTWIYNDASLFHDITSGNNGYAAGTGYDFCTGMGTPKAGTSL